MAAEHPFALPDRPVRLAVVLPIMAPYVRPVFEHLAAIQGIDLKVFVLKESLLSR